MSLKCLSKPKKAHSKHRGNSPSRNISSDTYRKEGLDWEIVYQASMLSSIISKITEGDTLKQIVADRYGNQIYLTDERWTHIVNTHPEMDSHRNNLLLTLQTGRRKQEPLDPSKYKYYKRFDILETGYNHIIVVVKFSDECKKNRYY